MQSALTCVESALFSEVMTYMLRHLDRRQQAVYLRNTTTAQELLQKPGELTRAS